jgi:hypothetical protein
MTCESDKDDLVDTVVASETPLALPQEDDVDTAAVTVPVPAPRRPQDSASQAPITVVLKWHGKRQLNRSGRQSAKAPLLATRPQTRLVDEGRRPET